MVSDKFQSWEVVAAFSCLSCIPGVPGQGPIFMSQVSSELHTQYTEARYNRLQLASSHHNNNFLSTLIIHMLEVLYEKCINLCICAHFSGLAVSYVEVSLAFQSTLQLPSSGWKTWEEDVVLKSK
jgi:hypothetical protein